MASLADSRDEQSVTTEETLTRSEIFEGFVEEILPTLQLNGLYFLTFRTDKIKFCFIPHDVTNYVHSRIRYYMSLRYWKNKYWRLRRHTCPTDVRQRIYKLFYNDYFYIVTDDNVISVLKRIHKILIHWCQKQEEFRLDKYQRFIRGNLDEIDLDSDDLEFFFDPDHRREIQERRERIWQRMLPPKQQNR